MHIYWFAHYNLTCPSVRYRGKYVLNHLAEVHKVSSDFIYPERSWKGIIRFLWMYCKALMGGNNSWIVIQKVCSNKWYAKALKLLVWLKKSNTLYDLDDAEYCRKSTKSLHFFLQNCEKVTVGSEALKKYCLQFNQNVALFTSPIPHHDFQKGNKNALLHIGWVGDFGNGKPVCKDFSHKKSLYDLLFPELILTKIPIKLTLIGVKNPSDIQPIKEYFSIQPKIQLEIPADLHWEEDSWLYPQIAQFDVGVSPMVKHPFNQAKSAFKAKQYLSVGVPCIASDVGENDKFVLHQKNGFLCQKEGDFLKYVNQIASMSEKQYYRLQQEALNRKEEYGLESYCLGLMRYMNKYDAPN